MKDIYSDLGMAQGVVPSVVSATTTDSGVDLQGFNSALVIVASGAIAGDGLFVTKLQDSDDDSTFADVADANLSLRSATLAASGISAQSQPKQAALLSPLQSLSSRATPLTLR
jgi:hypothetical protein